MLRDFLDGIWIEWRCPLCLRLSQPRESILKYRLSEVMQGGASADCQSCGTTQRIEGGSPEEPAGDIALWVALDDSWQRICDLIDSLGARLTVPPK